MKNKLCFLFAAFLCSGAFSQPSLEGYLSNDLELKRLALEVQKAELSDKETSINNGLDIKLSTGSATFRTQGDNTVISINPSATVSVPQASNLSFTASSDIKITDGNSENQDTSFKLQADILSGSSVSRSITLLKSERALLTAKRNLQNRALEAEKQYYTELKALYNTAISIINKKNELYDDTISFQKTKADGYDKNSSKYRQAQMEVLSDQHEIDTATRQLNHDCAVFASKCGVPYTSTDTPQSFLPELIPSVDPVNILDFKKDSYTKIEEAVWAQTLAELNRKADKHFTLSASGGYTIKNSSGNDADTVDAGLSFGWDGLSLNPGVSVPVNGDSAVYTLSASLNPNKFRTASISKKTDSINKQEEEISISSANDAYDTSVIDKQTDLEDIQWSKKTNQETYEMYQKLSDDLKRSFNAGLITESEYMSAFVNKESYRIKLLLDDINMIIYNNETKLLFYRDYEIEE